MESKPGKGSTFSFTIKAPIAADVTLETHFNTLIPELKGVKALIVDDNHNNRTILKLQCQKWGLVPTLAENGEEALQLLKDGKNFEIGLIDMHMPEMNGIELAKAIRKIKDSLALPLIMLSSMYKPEGFDFPGKLFSLYLSKPVKEAKLFDALRQTFAKTAYHRSLRRKAELATTDTEKDLDISLQILLVEDNLVNCKLAQKVLTKLNHQVDIAHNGSEALLTCEDKEYDLILMDCQMPIMNGYEATTKLREKGFAKPIIAMTAHAMEGDREKCLAAGMDDYIAKPFKQNYLKMIINKFFALS